MDAARYLAPAGDGASIITEKRSRFIGRVVHVTDEAAAKDEIARVRAEHHDARHNCWCYSFRGGAERYSDDGEPQGTAGLPMLEVFRRKGVVDVCCVVTRYFGGILLGAGRLSRAYSDCAGKALADAGIAQYRLFARIELTCAYSLIGRVTSEAAEIGCVIENVEYGERVVYSILAPVERADAAKARLADTLAGTDTIAAAGEKWMVI